VERRACTADRRVKVLLITPAAVPILRQAREIVLALEQELFEEMDRSDLAMCAGLLTRLSGKLDRA
jgi:DNA-binding MarR family transcriptional regulator